jgi:hypothetical protein
MPGAIVGDHPELPRAQFLDAFQAADFRRVGPTGRDGGMVWKRPKARTPAPGTGAEVA